MSWLRAKVHASAVADSDHPPTWWLLLTTWALPWSLVGWAVAIRVAAPNRRVGVGWDEMIGLFFANAVVAGVLFGCLLGAVVLGLTWLVRRSTGAGHRRAGWHLSLATSSGILFAWMAFAASRQANIDATQVRLLRIVGPLGAVLLVALLLWILPKLARWRPLAVLARGLASLSTILVLVACLALTAMFLVQRIDAKSADASDSGSQSAFVGFPPLEEPPTRDPSVPRLIVLGIDGLDWEIMAPLLDSGQLPHFSHLRAEGVAGRLGSMQPTLSPAIWTTVVTGRSPNTHGIVDFAVTEAPALGIERLFRPGALNVTRPILSRVADFRRKSISSRERRVKTLWNVCSEAGVSIGVVGWWASWPAEPIGGFIVTDHAYVESLQERLDRGFIDDIESGASTFPTGLQAELATLQKPVGKSTAADVERFVRLQPQDRTRFNERVAHYDADKRKMPLRIITTAVLKDRYYGAAALHLHDTYRPDVLLGYFSSVDWFSHSVLDMTLPDATAAGYSPEDIERYRESVPEAIRWMDEWLGEFIQRRDDDTHLVVLSDHGFSRVERAGGRVEYGHGSAPPGVFFAVGPAFRRGVPLEGLGILDIGPTLFYLAGLPVSDELEGRVAVDILTLEYQAQHPIRRIATYEAGAPVWSETGASEDDPELLNRLRALGYID